MEQEKSTLERCEEHFKLRMEDIYIFNELNEIENEAPLIYEKLSYDMGSSRDYGLSNDYVEEGTFSDQIEGYGRFQLSWGGPSEEFRIFEDGRVEFWFLDWGVGEHKNLDQDEINALFTFLGVIDAQEYISLYRKLE